MSRVWLPALLTLLLSPASRAAGGEDKVPVSAGPTPAAAADAALAAFRSTDKTALKDLAAKDNPDPWLVADALVERGEMEAAAAFAKAAPRKDTEALPAYVESRRGKEPDRAARVAADQADDALAKEDGESALAAAKSRTADPATIPGLRLLFGEGLALRVLHHPEESAAALSRAAEGAEALGWLRRSSQAFHEGGVSAAQRADWKTAQALWGRGLTLDEARGDRRSAATATASIGNVHRFLGDFPKAFEWEERALKVQEELGDRAGIAGTLVDLGMVNDSIGNYAKALDLYERAMKIMGELGDRDGVADTLANVAILHQMLGNFEEALRYGERALRTMEDMKDFDCASVTLGNLGNTHRALGHYAKALECHERALGMKESLGDRGGVADTLRDMGNVEASLGKYEKALDYLERALKTEEDLGDRADVAQALRGIGAVHQSLGNYAKAFEDYERALQIMEDLKDRAGAAATLQSMGELEESLGSYPKAIEDHERVLKMTEELGDRAGQARALLGLGGVHSALGDSEKAFQCDERALKMTEDTGDRAGEAVAVGNIGTVERQRGNHAKALAHHQRALALQETLGDRAGAAQSLANIGVDLREAGDLAGASKSFERAIREAERIHSDPTLLRALEELATTQVTAGQPALAVLNAKRGVALVEHMLGGLADEQGVEAREKRSGLFAVGALAAARTDDVAEAVSFLESGRAGTLLESLGGRQAVRWASVPQELREAEAQAQARERAALAAYSRALDGGSREEIRARDVVLDSARDGLEGVVERIQREAKKEASVWYPRAATLEEIEGWLQASEALVLYSLSLEEAHAVVLSRTEARIVNLGKVADLLARCEALRLGDVAVDAAAALASLRAAVVLPLGLPEDVTRVFVSTEGALSYVPFAPLLPGREVVYLPSGTTYGVLLDERAKVGSQVLALGDPAYEARADRAAPAVGGAIAGLRERGAHLLPLPGTRAEAIAVGDVTLLGKDASEGGLREAIARNQGRWRAIHFACHGIVDPERPTFSALALTPDAESDGFLTVLQVLRMDLRCDLVVLSACETGKGRVMEGEGIVGLTRAFMFAGSPRVICSLWKVDDDATRALMTKFYEGWNPKDASKRIGAAAALKAAQAFVRSQEKWKHPYYWAAWVLWGLAD